MSTKKRLFLILWLAGFAGVLSFLLIDLKHLIEIVPLPPGSDVPQMDLGLLKVISLIQPTVILSLAVLIGVGLSSKVGLSAPLAECIASRESWFASFKPQIVPAIIGGIGGGVAIVLTAVVSKPFLAPEDVKLIGEFGKLLPLPTRFLYGGITEELLLRWGLMTLLVWAMLRLFQKGQGSPKAAYFVMAILISSIIFGLGHLPIAFMLFREPTFPLMLFVVVANSTFGVIAGFLYWKKGLESAMIAHILTHLVLFTASYLGTYF